jgi:hypothetical protein
MREKSVKPQTIEKYIEFLNGVKENALPYECQVSLETIVTNYSINKSVVKPLQKLGIIERKSKKAWEWLKDEPDKKLVLELLDYVLHLKKPQEAALLPEYITQITDLLKEISAKLTIPQTIDESGADSLKTSDKRFEMAKAIAIGVYSAKKDFESLKNIDERNDYIIEATDNLLQKLNSR